MENRAGVRGNYIVPVVGATYTNRNGSAYICREVYMFAEARLERIKDSWTLYANGVQRYEDGTIEWDYSTGGYWARTEN
ncbi:conserved hypothetical protein [uncultured Eubacteriales bacterium]|uniref:Uncharacterized protein n=1 Tax=uncultured Eubacteriales bacterium TaxID=172733 RepID=A0A212IW83_9FIRM|nr:conserved hypothetical protein [uncultured Eubacteriales bacterium]